MRIKHIEDAVESIVHEGATFVKDEEGFFRIPFDLANTFLKLPHWVAEEAKAIAVVHPELGNLLEEPAENEGDEPELTPAEKGARTRALKAEAAAKAAENN